MTPITIGIDPGQTGGIAVLPSGFTEVMPDIWEFKRIMEFQADFENAHVYIERAQSFPKQGVSSSFNYGRHFGELLGILIAFGIPHTLVPPATWTRVIHAGTKGGDPKARTLEAVRRLFPNKNLCATARSTKPHMGIVDALAIAEYGRRQMEGKP